MQNLLKEWGPLLGRILIVQMFIPAGISKITNFSGTLGYMTAHHVPLAELALILSIPIELGCAFLILVGWKARWSAGILFLWVIPVNLFMHNFWAVSDPTMHMLTQILFVKDIAVMGALLLIASMGPGPKSLDKTA
jgi:putative oxidoreductase